MNATTPTAATSATPATASAAPAEPTAEQVQALISAGHVRSALPPKPGHRPRGRPRKDGQPPRQTDSGRNAAAIATAAARHIATNPIEITGTEERRINEIKKEPAAEEPPHRFADNNLIERARNLEMTSQKDRARTFLQVLANMGYKDACKAVNASPCTIHAWRQNAEFDEIYAEIMKAHDAATIARTCDTLATLANGEYKPRPDCLPPDMRAASLLMPAIDPRFRPNSQTAAQQVQINISI